MAENITWSVSRLAQHQKAVVWAHNGHVTKGKWRGYKAMGAYLNTTYKNNYYAMGLAFGEGYARLGILREPGPFIKLSYRRWKTRIAWSMYLNKLVIQTFF